MSKEFLQRSSDIAKTEMSPSSQPFENILKNGFIILDKPCGPTSQECVAHIKTMLGLSKAGQSGTLDPETSGVLLVTTENACKAMPLLNGMQKEYVTVMHVHQDIDDKKLRNAIKDFVGTITQLPPVKSAVKRQLRQRRVEEIQILDRIGKDVCLRVVCQAGTYIRKLIDDIGKLIGGAHMKELRRTRVGPFDERESHTLQEIRDAFADYKQKKSDAIKDIVLPIEYALRASHIIIIKDSAIANVRNGAPLYSTGVVRTTSDIKEKDSVAIVSLNGFLIAIGTALSCSNDIVKEKCVAAKVDRVL